MEIRLTSKRKVTGHHLSTLTAISLEALLLCHFASWHCYNSWTLAGQTDAAIAPWPQAEECPDLRLR